MLKKDLVIGIVGAVILVSAMVGVFRYEAARSGGSAFDVDWDTRTLAGPSTTGQTAEGAKSETTLNITANNLTSLVFSLVWTDDIGDPDEFELTVITPDGDSQTAKATAGRIDITFDQISSAPLPRRMLAQNEADADAQLASTQTSTVGTGTWSFVIQLLNAGDQTVPVAGVPITADTGNAWALETKQTVFAPAFTPGT